MAKDAYSNHDEKYSMDTGRNITITLADVLSMENENNQNMLQTAFKYINARGRVPPNDL